MRISRISGNQFRQRFCARDRNLEKRGYEDADPSAESGTECVEDNECKDGTHACPANSYCVNTDASYECDCYDGFYFGNNECNNINEVSSKVYVLVGC